MASSSLVLGLPLCCQAVSWASKAPFLHPLFRAPEPSLAGAHCNCAAVFWTYLGLARVSYSRACELENPDDGYTERDYDFVLSMRYSVSEEAWHRSAYAEYVRSLPFAVCDGEGNDDNTLDSGNAVRRSNKARSCTRTCS